MAGEIQELVTLIKLKLVRPEHYLAGKEIAIIGNDLERHVKQVNVVIRSQHKILNKNSETGPEAREFLKGERN